MRYFIHDIYVRDPINKIKRELSFKRLEEVIQRANRMRQKYMHAVKKQSAEEIIEGGTNYLKAIHKECETLLRLAERSLTDAPDKGQDEKLQDRINWIKSTNAMIKEFLRSFAILMACMVQLSVG